MMKFQKKLLSGVLVNEPKCPVCRKDGADNKTNNKKLFEELDNSQKNYRESQKKVSDIELELQEKENIIVKMYYQKWLSEVEKEKLEKFKDLEEKLNDKEKELEKK